VISSSEALCRLSRKARATTLFVAFDEGAVGRRRRLFEGAGALGDGRIRLARLAMLGARRRGCGERVAKAGVSGIGIRRGRKKGIAALRCWKRRLRIHRGRRLAYLEQMNSLSRFGARILAAGCLTFMTHPLAAARSLKLSAAQAGAGLLSSQWEALCGKLECNI